MKRPFTLLCALMAVACSRTPPPTKIAPVVSAAPAQAASEPGPATCPGDAERGVSCRRFASTEDAFRQAIRGDVAVLALGEAHAQKGTESVASATKRFTEELLPLVAKDAADVVVELWAPDPACQKDVKAVARAQRPVVEAQATENKNEYVTLGTKAKELGVTPWLLRPTCDDFAALADAGADAVPAMLALVRRLTEEKVKRLVAKNVKERKMTIAYGGAMHNDVEPTEATAAYSFGPELARSTQSTGRAYVELDLIVPEYVKKTPVWEKLPWFGVWERDRASSASETRLYAISHGAGRPVSYVLIFPAAPANLADR